MRVFDYDGIRTAVRSTDPSALDWLEEIVSPWFRAGAGGEGPGIDVRVDPDEVCRIVDEAEPTGRRVDCFTMDGARAPWIELRADNGAALAWEPDLRVVLRVRPGAVELIAESGRPRLRLALLRALRELAGTASARRGALPLHASAVAVDGRVTLFAGGKRSGKSTLLLHALRDAGTRHVSNDRVYVNGTTARGMPTVISLREESLGEVSGLRDELASGAWHHTSTVAEARAHRAAGTVAPGAGLRRPPGLSAAQFCALLGTSAVAGGEVERIVFPRIAPEVERFEVRAMNPDEAGARLLESGLLAGGRVAGFLSGGPQPARAALEAAAHRLVAAVPCFACRLGPRAYEAPGVWAALRTAGPC